MSEYVIIADGPFLDKKLIQTVIQNRQIIALDGAANQLRQLSITPHVILGDFDSIDAISQTYWGIIKTFDELHLDDAPYQGNHQVLIVPAADQNLTDLEKGIEYCDKQGAKQITLLCAAGGREDQHEGMKIALRTAYRRQRPIWVHTTQQTLRYAENESITFYGHPGDYCGFVAVNHGLCSADGLLYPCHDLPYSVCNRLQTTSATIHIKGGALLIMPLQFNFSS